MAVDTVRQPPAEIRLVRVRPKALYLSVFGIGSRTLREAALELVDTTELNALVIDVKGDRGLIGYRSAIALAEQAGAQRVITIPDLDARAVQRVWGRMGTCIAYRLAGGQ